MKKIIDSICTVLRNLTGLMLIAIIACVTIQIISRSVLHISSPWTEEVAKYLLIWMTFIGSPVALKNGEHLFVDLFYSRYSDKSRQWIHLLSDVTIAIFCLYLLYFGMALCLDPRVMRFSSPAAAIPRSLIYAALPVGAVMMLFIALYDVYNTAMILKGKIADTTASGVVDEKKTLAEIDFQGRNAD